MAEKRIVFTTDKVKKITKQLADGFQIPREMNPWWSGEVGVRKAGLTFSLTEEELAEYWKCAVDVHHFAENYCKIKTEDGSVKNIKLRDYQKDILDLYDDNRFSILMASRQVGKCISFKTKVIVRYYKNGNIIEDEIPIYKLFHYAKKRKGFLDYLKYGIYKMIEKLED